MKVLFAIAAVAAAGFALPSTALAAARCDVVVSAPWVSGDPDKNFVVEAIASGPDCDNAVLMLVIRDQYGYPHWQEAYGGDVRNQTSAIEGSETFEDGLKRWITTGVAMTADQLPEWKDGVNAEDVPGIWIADRVVREDYKADRAAKYPMLCYLTGFVNGSEPAKTCVVWRQTSYFAKVGMLVPTP